MPLKHLFHLLGCADQPCPNPKKFCGRSVRAYRFMHSPANEGTDFTAPALTCYPPPGAGTRCDAFALSFFDTVENARQKYRILAERVDAEARYGGFVGEILLMESDGVCSTPNHDGHFGLHPETTALFAERVVAYSAAGVAAESHGGRENDPS